MPWAFQPDSAPPSLRQLTAEVLRDVLSYDDAMLDTSGQ